MATANSSNKRRIRTVKVNRLSGGIMDQRFNVAIEIN